MKNLFILRRAGILLPEPQAEDAAGPLTLKGLQHPELSDMCFGKVMVVPGLFVREGPLLQSSSACFR